MTDRQARIKTLRDKLKSLTPEQRQALVDRGIITTIEGRTLSLHNTIMVYLQCNGNKPTVVGGFKQWLKAGKAVKKGEHGYTIFFPVGEKDDIGNIITADKFYTATIFDIAQTHDIETDKPTPQPEVKPQLAVTPQPVAQHNNNDTIMKGWRLV